MSDTETKTDPDPDPDVVDPPIVPELADASAAKSGEDRARGKPKRGILGEIFGFLSSFLFTIIILLCLMVLTYFGTYAQKSIGLVKAQQVYFDSFICRLHLAPLGLEDFYVRFPGAFLLLILLAVNLIMGGLIRMKWRKRNTGIIIVHFGMVFMLISGLVKFASSTNGYVQLWPNEKTNVYTSFHEWEIVIGERRGDGKVREHIIPDGQLRRLGSFRSDAVPFKLVVDKFFENSRPRQSQTKIATDVVDGVYLDEAPWHEEAPMNIAGAYVRVLIEGESPQRGLVWGAQDHPWTVDVQGIPWTIDLRKRVYDLPFEVRLEKFSKKEHPGITLPSHFSSDVTKIEDGVEQKFHVAMNNPMRYGGFMFSQNNWGPQDGRPGPYYTVLEVSSNPSDQWPKYACYVIAFGLLWHFRRKLVDHIKKQNKLRAQEVVA